MRRMSARMSTMMLRSAICCAADVVVDLLHRGKDVHEEVVDHLQRLYHLPELPEQRTSKPWSGRLRSRRRSRDGGVRGLCSAICCATCVGVDLLHWKKDVREEVANHLQRRHCLR